MKVYGILQRSESLGSKTVKVVTKMNIRSKRNEPKERKFFFVYRYRL